MALPGHSPPPFATASSPPRLLNGHPESHFSSTMFGHSRPMLPPSPQNFPPPRYQQASVPPPSLSMPGSMYDVKGSQLPPPPQLSAAPPQNSYPHKRPNSSMSILSVLGDQPERIAHEIPPLHNPNNSRSGSMSTAPMSIGAMMSPPQQPARAGISEYAYGRSQTPDRIDSMLATSRQRSASGPTRPMFDQDRYPKPPTPLFQNTIPFATSQAPRDDQSDSARRTSINSLLQRPSSQPQSFVPPQQPSRLFDPLPPQRQAWYADPPSSMAEPQRINGTVSTYDTRPPGFRDAARAIPTTQPSPSAVLSSVSPETRRATTVGAFNKGFANLLNGPTSQPADSTGNSSQNMARQDSTQSQPDRSLFGERGRFRHFSPFAGQGGSQNLSNGTNDDAGRKGSDELSYKSIIGLGLENGRRYSPVPQAVQGAQAQTPVPDGGVKSERGRVFSGIGGDIGPSSAGPTPTPGPKPASPFKKDDSVNRLHESTSRMARTTSNIGKRSRKVHDDESRGDGEHPEGKKPNSTSKSNKRTKYQNSYKADLEEMATPSVQRRGTPLSGAGLHRSATNLSSGATGTGTNTRYDTGPIFKPKKTVKLTTVMSQTLRKPRRHLGTFQYEPEVLVSDDVGTSDPESEVLIKPKVLPSFSAPEALNSTYTIQVSKTWLQDRERRLVCSTRNLWGTGIYTDDTDPLAAAMHMGWIKPSFNANVDETLLKRVVQDQNPKVDMPKEFKPPSQPVELLKGRDLKITLVVMPQLEHYEETSRFGVRSRSWPETTDSTPHDGVSFSILKVEVSDIGPEERRIGRTGASRRARLKAQLEQRILATKLEEERVARVTKRLQEKAQQAKESATNNYQSKDKKRLRDGQKSLGVTRSPLVNEIIRDADETPTVAITATNLDTEEWMRQLATAAA